MKKCDIKEKIEYAILTSEISKATFGLTPNEYKNYKRTKRIGKKILNCFQNRRREK
jgi:hypothetical protein